MTQFYADEHSDIDRWQEGYMPQSGIKPGPESLPEGSYDLEITYAELTKAGTPPQSIFKLGLRVMSGPRMGFTLERPTFFRRQESVDYLGGELIVLGMDAEQWGRRGKTWSQELREACPRLVGVRFVGTKRNVPSTKTPGQVFHNLNITAALQGSSAAAPPPGNGQPPLAAPRQPQQPVLTGTPRDTIPF